MAEAPPSELYSPRRWAALAVTLVAVLMDMIDATVVNIALPSLQRNLHASSTQLQWSVAGYTLAFASGMIAGGRLGDRYGRRRMFLTGLVCFLVFSALAGLASDPNLLIAARVLQGASAALMVPQVLAMIQVEFPRAEFPKAMSMYGLTFAVGGLGGPLLGGLLIDANLFGWDWRPIFYVNVLIGIPSLVGAWLLMRESRAPGAVSLDLPGTAIVTAGLLALLYPLVEGRTLGWPWWTFALMACCVPIFLLFWVYERGVVRRGQRPMIDPGLFRQHSVVGGLLVATLFFAGTAYTLVLTVHLQTGTGYSPLHTALSLIPFTVGLAAGVPLAPRMVVLGRRVAMAGSLVLAAGMGLVTIAIARYGTGLHSWQLIPGLLIGGFGMQMVSGTLINLVLSRVPPRQSGAASSLVNTSIQVGLACGVALVGTVYFDQLALGHGAVHSATVGMLLVIGLYVLAACAALILPPGRIVRAEQPRPVRRADAADPAGH